MFQVGESYDVPVLPLGAPIPYAAGQTLTLAEWHGFTGDLPLLNDWAVDEPFVANETIKWHVHIDWRFIQPKHMHYFQHLGLLPTKVMTMPWEQYLPYLRPVVKRLRCWRPMPAGIPCNAELAARYACAALAAGRCPHRGTSEAAMVRVGGALVCPAHGLRWHPETKKAVV